MRTTRLPAGRLYFRAQVAATVALCLGERLLGLHDWQYAALYIIVTVPIIEMCWIMVWEYRPSQENLLTSLGFALFVGCFVADSVPWTLSGYIVFSEGVILAGTGVAMLLTSAETIIWTIGTLSLALSGFDFIYLRNPSWERANGWLPSWFCITAFGWLAARQWISGKMIQEASHGI